MISITLACQACGSPLDAAEVSPSCFEGHAGLHTRLAPCSGCAEKAKQEGYNLAQKENLLGDAVDILRAVAKGDIKDAFRTTARAEAFLHDLKKEPAEVKAQ